MPFAEWPASLPQAMLLGHSNGSEVDVVAFAPQVGAPVLFQVGDSRSSAVQGTLRVSDSQLADFLEFYRDDLRNGSRRFDWTSDSFDGATLRLQFDPSNPFSYQAQAIGWLLSVSLTVVRQVA